MPDYDPKSIPILDDIIEDDKTEPDLTDSDIADIESEQDNDQSVDNLDLFDNTATDMEAETTGPELGTIDQFLEPAEDATVESALIDYHPEEIDEPAIDIQPEAAELDEIQVSDEISIDNNIDETATVQTQPASLDAIVDDIVKQLIPDLEQQLRFLVQQALEDRLPAELVEQISADKDD